MRKKRRLPKYRVRESGDRSIGAREGAEAKAEAHAEAGAGTGAEAEGGAEAEAGEGGESTDHLYPQAPERAASRKVKPRMLWVRSSELKENVNWASKAGTPPAAPAATRLTGEAVYAQPCQSWTVGMRAKRGGGLYPAPCKKVMGELPPKPVQFTLVLVYTQRRGGGVTAAATPEGATAASVKL